MDETSNPVHDARPGTPRSCSTPGAVATTGNQTILDLSVILGNVFESRCIMIKSTLELENLNFIMAPLSLCNFSRALLTDDRLKIKSIMFKDRASSKTVIMWIASWSLTLYLSKRYSKS